MALIPIPEGWTNPRFQLNQRVRYYDEPTRESFEGIIIGIRYYVPAPGEISNGSWEYDVLTDFYEGRIHNISAAFENYLTKLPSETGPSLN